MADHENVAISTSLNFSFRTECSLVAPYGCRLVAGYELLVRLCLGLLIYL